MANKTQQKTIERNAIIIKQYEQVPRRSMADIGREHGVSRAYIQQIVKAHYANRTAKTE